MVAERQRRPIVYRDQKGSTPFHRAMSGADDRFYRLPNAAAGVEGSRQIRHRSWQGVQIVMSRRFLPIAGYLTGRGIDLDAVNKVDL